MRFRLNASSTTISLGLLVALITAPPAQAQFWPTSVRRTAGERTTTRASQPVATRQTARMGLGNPGRPDPLADAWRDFNAARGEVATDPRWTAGIHSESTAIAANWDQPGHGDPGRQRGLGLTRWPDPTGSYYPGLRSGRGRTTCSPSRASLLVQAPPRPVVREELPRPQAYQSWDNHQVAIPTISALSRRRGRE